MSLVDCLVDNPASGLQWLFCLHAKGALEPNVAGDQWSEKQNTGGGGFVLWGGGGGVGGVFSLGGGGARVRGFVVGAVCEGGCAWCLVRGVSLGCLLFRWCDK